jgi:hypothetical protein
MSYYYLRCCFFLLVMLIANGAANAQKTKKDDNIIFREFAKLGGMYKKLPVQLSIQIYNSAIPVTAEKDTIHAEMEVFYGSHAFYMQAEGLEQIINDSLIVLVNSSSKQILLYPNNLDMLKNMEKAIAMFMPDSSIDRLSQQYNPTSNDIAAGIKKISLVSRQMVGDTKLPKEIISVTFKAKGYEMIEFCQSNNRLVPIDSAVYASLLNAKDYQGRLLNSPSSNGNIYFIIKEATTTYQFTKVDHTALRPPANELDRIVKNGDGDYTPAKGYEDYLLRKEF